MTTNYQARLSALFYSNTLPDHLIAVVNLITRAFTSRIINAELVSTTLLYSITHLNVYNKFSSAHTTINLGAFTICSETALVVAH